MNEQFLKAIQSSHDAVTEELDRQLLTFFGSIEKARQFGHLYVLEQKPMEFETMQGLDFSENAYKMRITSKWVIRFKTEKELEADRRD